MAEERIGTPEGEARTYWAWTELFRTFQVALDPKKLALAAVGIFVMWVGWWLLSVIFYNSRSEPRQSDYDVATYQKRYNLSEADARIATEEAFRRDHAEYVAFYSLAGEGIADAPEEWKRPRGAFRVEPWNENRGPNPFLLVTGQLGESSSWRGTRTVLDWLFTQQVPVLIEPLVKFLYPIGLLLNPKVGGVTRLYLLLVTLWTLATWAFFGGAITRLAAVQLAGKDRPGLVDTLRFVAMRYLSYLAAPIVPLIFVALIVILSIIYGLVLHIWPFVGDVIDSVAFPILVLLGFGQAVLLVGLVGYPLMYATVSAEGSDTFDALSRSYNYVFQSPWNYIWYSLVAILYGAVLVFFVVFMGSFVVYLTKWSVSQTPMTETTFPSRRIDNWFVGAPTSFEWHRLLASNAVADSITGLAWYNQISAFMVSLWVRIIFLLMIGFAYSYFFSAFTMVYLLMRRKVDDTELDEVYLEEDEPEEPLLPPSPVAPSGQTTTGQPLQMVEAPALRTPPATPPTVAVSDGNAAAPPPAPTPAEPAAPPPADGGPPLG
jgi:hypothetical protein